MVCELRNEHLRCRLEVIFSDLCTFRFYLTFLTFNKTAPNQSVRKLIGWLQSASQCSVHASSDAHELSCLATNLHTNNATMPSSHIWLPDLFLKLSLSLPTHGQILRETPYLSQYHTYLFTVNSACPPASQERCSLKDGLHPVLSCFTSVPPLLNPCCSPRLDARFQPTHTHIDY